MSDEQNENRYPHETERAARTRLIHGVGRSRKWEYNHCVVPPISSSATFRLDSVHRGTQGFVEFAHLTPESEEHVPIYIYDLSLPRTPSTRIQVAPDRVERVVQCDSVVLECARTVVCDGLSGVGA